MLCQGPEHLSCQPALQEPGGGTLVSYARQVEGAVRKADDRRKRARESKAERQAAAAAARQEEVRRLKAIKRREIEERCARNPLALAAMGAMRS